MDGMSSPILFGVDILNKLGYDLLKSKHDRDVCNLIVRSELLPENEKILSDLLAEMLLKFSELPSTNRVSEHVIKMKSDVPFRQRYYPRNPRMKAVINEQVDELLEN